MTNAPFSFSMTYSEAVAAGLQPETTETIESSAIVRGEDGRLARFVAIDRSGPHPIAWVSYQGCAEYGRMLSRAIAVNEDACPGAQP